MISLTPFIVYFSIWPGVPTFTEETSDEDLDNLINVSRVLNLPFLETICVNHRNEEEFLNPSIGTYLNDDSGKKLKDMFLNKPTLNDVTFLVEGKPCTNNVVRVR